MSLKRGAIEFARHAMVLAIALVAYAIVLAVTGKDPAAAFGDTLSYTLGSWQGLAEVVMRMIPLLLTALAVALPSKLGLINVGGEGQLYMGAWLATWGAISFPALPAAAFVPLLVLLGFVGGGLWAAVAGWFRARGWVNETITTLLMNYIAPLVVGFSVYGSWRSLEAGSSAYPQSIAFPEAARLPRYFGTRINLGLLIALAALLLIWFVLEKTKWGLTIRAIGGNPDAARRLGFNIGLYTVVVMFVGGGIAGLAGMAEVSAIHGRLRAGFSPGYGFMGFLISWLAAGRPLGIFSMSFILAVIFSTGSLLQITQGVPFATINVLMAIVLLIVLAKPRALGGLGMNWAFFAALLSGTIMYGVPLLYATLGEVVGQRAGMVNLGLEGILLIGASVGFAVSVATGSAWLGIGAAAAAGALFNLVYFFLVVRRRANQLASGLTAMFLGTGLSAMIGKDFIGSGIAGLPRYRIPGVASLPFVAKTMFNYDLLVYLAVPLAVLVWFCLFRTRWGLGLRAVGEDPSAAFAAGRKVGALKCHAAIICGALGGIAGAHLSIALARTWTEGMTGGRGYIAVALVIFSKWHPLRALFGALLFGGAVTLQLQLQASGAAVSPFLLNMIPYVVTLGVLLAWSGSRRFAAPGALGRVYSGEE